MRLVLLLSALWCGAALSAAELDNESGRYVLSPLPDPVREARRMDRMQLSDQQPAGRFVRRGETLVIQVQGLTAGHVLAATVGFLPMWGSQQSEQVQRLSEGENRLRVEQDGPLFFRYNTPARKSTAPAEVLIELEGGTPLPLFVDANMDGEDWAQELDAHADAPYVQLISEHALITLPAADHAREPIDDPNETLAVLEQVLAWQDELAGFDGSSARDRRSPLRFHYLVDFRVSPRDRENFYMYATDQFIGMLDINFNELTDPDQLREKWGIWHETGHMHQQHSWTFEALVEVNVNIFSLYVQERFGQTSTLLQVGEEGGNLMDLARDYLAQGAPDYTAEVDEDGEGFFIKLVMFHQLKETYGWELYQDLHKHFRAHPLPEDAEDSERVDAFVEAMCELTGHDLRAFFETWGLRASEEAYARLDAAGLQELDSDPSEIFE